MQMTKDKDAGLLECIASEVGCMYLSDLHQARLLETIRKVVFAIDPAKYSVSEWNDAVFYITGHKAEFETQTKAKDFLLHDKGK